ncbi:hypothetical protein BCY80_07610 [Yersinia pestis]|nr:hypothetical protein BCY80_07610 [Yersinia pestis]
MSLLLTYSFSAVLISENGCERKTTKLVFFNQFNGLAPRLPHVIIKTRQGFEIANIAKWLTFRKARM